MTEIQIMESLKSAAYIVGIEDYEIVEKPDTIGWTIFIRMELLTDLGTYMETSPLSEKEVVRLGIEIANALCDCEKANIIHRDIKINNVFVNRYGTFKLGDFGISKQLEKTQSAVSQKGTNMYMAPEVFRGESYDKTVDIYSLGIMMYRLLNQGRFPFMPFYPAMIYYEDNQKAMQRRINGETVPPIPGIDPELSSIIIKACDAKKENRYQSPAEFHKALVRYRDKTSSVPDQAAENKDIGKTAIQTSSYEDERTQAVFSQSSATIQPNQKNEKAVDASHYTGVHSRAGGTSDNEENSIQKKKQKGNFKIPVWAMIAVAVLLLGVGGFCFLKLAPGKTAQKNINYLEETYTDYKMFGIKMKCPKGWDFKDDGEWMESTNADMGIRITLGRFQRQDYEADSFGYMKEPSDSNMEAIASHMSQDEKSGVTLLLSTEKEKIGNQWYIVLHYLTENEWAVSYNLSNSQTTHMFTVLGKKQTDEQEQKEQEETGKEILRQMINSADLYVQSIRGKLYSNDLNNYLECGSSSNGTIYLSKDHEMTFSDYDTIYDYYRTLWSGKEYCLYTSLPPGEYYCFIVYADELRVSGTLTIPDSSNEIVDVDIFFQ